MNLIPEDYVACLKSIKERIQQARFQAVRSVNREMIELYWHIGKEIAERKEKLGWGRAIVEKLSHDLIKSFPGMTGFSTRNLWEMKRFYQKYVDYPILQQLVAEIPWGHHLVILNKVKEMKACEYYLRATIEQNWSRNILLNQINSKAFERRMVNAIRDVLLRVLSLRA
ncbi:MAG: DUF1016 N-terminal domain-containing protein [Deltaproteobacteria bacterium]|nr:DUF1016 N-terminal domain-containing protein [Deltaproteobacteria bacterium]